MRQLVFPLAPPAPTFENFVPGRNAELLAVLRAIASGHSPERFVYFWGETGCGKTHLLTAVAGELAAVTRPVSLAASENRLLEQGVFSTSTYLTDDVDRLSATGQTKLFQIYNAVRESAGVLLAAGSAPPARLGLRADLVTRLGWGLVYQLHPLSDDDKASALAEHAQARGFDLSREVIDYLLQRQRRDLPNLIAILDALDRYSLETKRVITVPLVRELLSVPADQR